MLTHCEVKLKSLKDQTLNTGVETVELIEGEIFRAVFKNQMVVNNLIDVGVIAEVPSIVALTKEIPVVKPKIDTLFNELGETLPLSSESQESEDFVEVEKTNLSDFFGERLS